jgi:hypothetical protein
MTRTNRFLLAAFSLVAILLTACPTSDERGQVLTLKISEKNDSLLTFDSLTVTVHSKDGKFSQEVFHGVLRDPNQVKGLPLDSRAGDDYTITIVGYKDGKVGVNKEVTFIGSGSQSKDVPIKKDTPETVVVVPDLPEIQTPSDTTIAENDFLHFRISVRNPWAGATTLTLKDSIPGAVLEMAGRDAGDGYFTWRPSFEQGRAEPYAVTFVYASATQKVEKVTRVKVGNVNRPPKLSPIENKTGKPGSLITFQVTATDPDGPDGLIASADVKTLPSSATFAQGTFNWTPNASQIGNYPIKFRAEDGSAGDSLTVILSIGNVNRPPALSFTADTTLFENDSLVLLISSSDPDGTTPKLAISGNPALPRGCTVTLDRPRAGQGIIAWRPDFDQSRKDPYRFIIRAEDESTQVEKALTITIQNRNRPPKLVDIGNKTVNAGETLSFEVTATDPDGDSLTYVANTPAEASFSNRRFTWTPKPTAAGNFSATFKVTDGFAQDSQVVTLSVGAVNRPPEFSPLTDATTKYGDSLSIAITANDPENKSVTITATNLPPGGKLSQTAPGNALFTWKINADPPNDTTYSVTLSASDGEIQASRILKITVKRIGPPPVADAGQDTAVSIKDTVRLRGGVTGSASPLLSWAWDIGSTGKFIKTSRGDTSIQVGGATDSVFLCVLKVSDPYGREDRDTMRIRITDNSPKTFAGNDTLVGLVGSKTLIGKAQDDGHIVKYEWDIGNKGTFNESPDGRALLSAQGQLPLDFTCVLRVTDDDGHSALDTVVVHFNMDWKAATTSAAFPERARHGFLVFNEKLWAIGGPGSDDVWYSADGIEWKAATVSAGWGQREQFATTVFGGKIWLFGGSAWSQPGEADGLRSDIWNTSDGANWNKVLAMGGYPASQDLSVLVYNNKLWMFTRMYPVASDLTITDFQVWTSNDGLAWQKTAEKIPSMPYSKFTAEVFDGKMWILGNDNDSTSAIAAWSTDGLTWKSVRGPDSFLPRAGHSSAVYNGKLWIIGGMARNDATYRNDIWYSADGMAWKQATSNGPFPGRILHRSLTFNNRLWITGGTAKRGAYRDVWFTEDKP